MHFVYAHVCESAYLPCSLLSVPELLYDHVACSICALEVLFELGSCLREALKLHIIK